MFAGAYVHDVDDGISYGRFETGAQIVVGARTARLDKLDRLGRPQAHLLVGVNTAGGTNYAAAGLSWRINVSERLYVRPGLGVAVHDGRVNLPSPGEPGITPEEFRKRVRDYQTKLDLGSRVLFEPELSVGWQANPRLAMELSWIHLSHGRLAGRYNPGVADLGMRVVYRYGADR